MVKIPKYDFKCDKCGITEEINCSFDKSEEGFPCRECSYGIMERQFSPDGTVFQIRWGKPKVRQKVKRTGA